MLENKHEPNDFFESALVIKGSVTPKVYKKVLFFAFYAALISFLNQYYPYLTLPIGPFEYGGLIMGLILVFRLNSGYDRWWEARKLWGSVVNHSRNLSLILSQYGESDTARDWRHTMAGYIIAFPYLMADLLRNERNFEPLRGYFSEKNFQALSNARHAPVFLNSLMTKELNQARVDNKLDNFSFLRAEETRSMLIDSLGSCERILKTPMPLVMAIKVRRFILLFLLVLPLALANLHAYLINPFVSGLVAYALLSLDQIGLDLQNPFSEENLSHLPLQKICEGIRLDVSAIFEEQP